MESPSLEVLRRHLDVAFGDMFSGDYCGAGLTAGLDFEGLLQP